MLNKISILAILAILSLLVGCQTTGDVLSKTDEVLGDAVSAVSAEDTVTGRRSLNFTSDEEADKRAREHINSILQDARQKGVRIYSGSDPEYQRVKRIYDRVLSVSHYSGKHGLELQVLDGPFNALAFGGGHIIVYKGLLDETNDDELAYVIGHELAHNAANHVGERQAFMMAKQALSKNIKEGYGETYTNVHEQEADSIGILYSALAGYDPYASVSTWQKRQVNIAQYAYFRSHPIGPERAKLNRQTANKVAQYYSKGVINQDHEQILACNVLFCPKNRGNVKAGQGGGLLSAMEVILDTAVKDQKAKAEHAKQERERQIALQKIGLTPPNVNWRKGFNVYKGTVRRHKNKTGLNFGISNGAGEFFYNFNGKVERGTLEYQSKNEYGYWFRWADKWGKGFLNLKEYTDGSLRGTIYMDDGTDPGRVLGDWVGHR